MDPRLLGPYSPIEYGPQVRVHIQGGGGPVFNMTPAEKYSTGTGMVSRGLLVSRCLHTPVQVQGCL